MVWTDYPVRTPTACAVLTACVSAVHSVCASLLAGEGLDAPHVLSCSRAGSGS